jgi:hypothetical protein
MATISSAKTYRIVLPQRPLEPLWHLAFKQKRFVTGQII